MKTLSVQAPATFDFGENTGMIVEEICSFVAKALQPNFQSTVAEHSKIYS